MRLFYSLIQLFDTCYSHFWSFFSPHFFLISREINTFCWDFFFSTIVSALRLAAVLVASLLWLRIRFHIFSTVFCGSMSNWKQVYCIARLAIDNKTNKWRTNEKKNYEFSCKEFFPCRCIHWKSCLSNSFDTYECFENMFQQRMLYTYIWLQAKMGIFICTCELDSLTQNIPFHSNAMKCPCAISKQSLVRSNRLHVKSKENNLSKKKFIHWHFLGK